MHGALVTVHVTSPTSLLFPRIVRVLEMSPLMSSATATSAENRSATAMGHVHTHNLILRMVPFFSRKTVTLDFRPLYTYVVRLASGQLAPA